MFWGLAWYWWAVMLGLLIPWVTIYREVRDNFDDGFMFGLKIYLGISAVTVTAVLVLGFVGRWLLGKI